MSLCFFFFFQAEDGIRDLVRSRGLGDVYKRQSLNNVRIDDIDWFDGKLVLATKGKGVLILDGDRLIEVNEQKGLCSDLINKIIIEGNDIWCATNKGVGHIRMEQGEISSLTISNIYSSNGLLSDEINDITLLQDTVYVVANSGISFFNTHIDVVNHTCLLYTSDAAN